MSIGINTLTYKLFFTVLTQIEICLNTSPLCTLCNDLNDCVCWLEVILIGVSLLPIPEYDDLIDINSSRLRFLSINQNWPYTIYWMIVCGVFISIQQHAKWFHVLQTLKWGDLVLIKSDQLLPNDWEIGIHPGCDNRDQVAKAETWSQSVLWELPFYTIIYIWWYWKVSKPFIQIHVPHPFEIKPAKFCPIRTAYKIKSFGYVLRTTNRKFLKVCMIFYLKQCSHSISRNNIWVDWKQLTKNIS